MELHRRIQSKEGLELVEWVRSVCRELPEAEEVIDGFGHNTFKVKGKSFIIMGENEEGTSLSFKSDRETQAILVQQARYVKTPYIGHHGWVSVMNNETLDRQELQQLLKEAYLRAAPKRLVKQLLSEQAGE